MWRYRWRHVCWRVCHVSMLNIVGMCAGWMSQNLSTRRNIFGSFSAIFGNLWKSLENGRTTLGKSSQIFEKLSEIFGKSSKINQIIYGCLEIWNFSCCVQLDISLACCAHSWDIELVRTLEKKFHISAHPCIILYMHKANFSIFCACAYIQCEYIIVNQSQQRKQTRMRIDFEELAQIILHFNIILIGLQSLEPGLAWIVKYSELIFAWFAGFNTVW